MTDNFLKINCHFFVILQKYNLIFKPLVKQIVRYAFYVSWCVVLIIYYKLLQYIEE